MAVSYSLAPFSGLWTKNEAGHLLRRTTFGASFLQIKECAELGMDSAVDSLMSNTTPSPPPLAYHEDEIIASHGTTWINSVYPSDSILQASTNSARVKSLYAWLMENLNNSQDQLSINEKMVLFWQNHFGLFATADARGEYDYVKLLRSHSLGNFKELLKEVSIHPEMLVFLNGNTNSKNKPNENFARELLELFTVGKGPQVGPGDYTNYTEHDISECSKVFTGYIVQGFRSSWETSYYSEFREARHNNETKKLSTKFGGAIIEPNGADEYVDLIDVIFLSEEVSKNICRKIYRYFVSSEISSRVEETIIRELSYTFRSANFEIQPVLEQLFKSEHFYDQIHLGCLIKGPLEMIFSLLNGTETKANYGINTRYQMYLAVYHQAGKLDQYYLAPPSVAGWPAYYQEPSYSRLWLNASLIKGRFDLIDWWVRRKGIKKEEQRLQVEGLKFLGNLSFPSNPVAVINDMVDVFLPKGTSESQKKVLKDVLCDGLPDFEWTVQYNDYIVNYNNPLFYDPIIKRLKETLATIFLMPEFQTM